MNSVRLLQGRVAVRQIHRRSLILITPDAPKGYGTSHLGVVLGYGPPATTKKGGAIVPYDFNVGDTVSFVFHYSPTEEARQGVWTDGEPCVYVHQDEVIAVVEEGSPVA